jgi:PAS domain-containing protein
MSTIPTRFDPSDDARHTTNKYFLLAASRALADLKRSCYASPTAFRYIGDVLLAEARLLRHCTDYGLFRRHAGHDHRAGSPLLAVRCARSMRWLRMDPRLERYLGYRCAECPATFGPATAPDADPRSLPAYRELLAGAVSFYRAEERFMTRPGYSVWATVTHSLVRDRFGRPDRFVLAFEDATLERWNGVFYAELTALRALMAACEYRGEHFGRVDGLLRHFDGEPVAPAVIGQLVAMFTSVR